MSNNENLYLIFCRDTSKDFEKEFLRGKNHQTGRLKSTKSKELKSLDREGVSLLRHGTNPNGRKVWSQIICEGPSLQPNRNSSWLNKKKRVPSDRNRRRTSYILLSTKYTKQIKNFHKYHTPNQVILMKQYGPIT